MSAIAQAHSIAQQFLEKLDAIEDLLNRQLAHQESNAKNFLGAGSVAEGGVLGIVPQPVVNGNPRRRGFSFQNLGAAGSITLGLGLTTPTPGTGITLAPGQSWDGTVSKMLWLGSISMVGSQAGCVYSWLDA